MASFRGYFPFVCVCLWPSLPGPDQFFTFMKIPAALLPIEGKSHNMLGLRHTSGYHRFFAGGRMRDEGVPPGIRLLTYEFVSVLIHNQLLSP